MEHRNLRLVLVVLAVWTLLVANLACGAGRRVNPTPVIVVVTPTPGSEAAPTAAPTAVPTTAPTVEEGGETPLASGQPSLVIMSVTLSNNAPVVNEWVIVEVTVANQGGAAAENFDVVLIPQYGDGPPNPAGLERLPSLAPGEEAVVKFEPGIIYVNAGTYTLRVLVTDDWYALGNPDSTGSGGAWQDVQITVGGG